MADFVDSFFFGFYEGATGVESVLFEEKADLVAGGQEIVVPIRVGGVFGGGEFG